MSEPGKCTRMQVWVCMDRCAWFGCVWHMCTWNGVCMAYIHIVRVSMAQVYGVFCHGCALCVVTYGIGVQGVCMVCVVVYGIGVHGVGEHCMGTCIFTTIPISIHPNFSSLCMYHLTHTTNMYLSNTHTFSSSYLSYRQLPTYSLIHAICYSMLGGPIYMISS